jgi:hypothetical protein
MQTMFVGRPIRKFPPGRSESKVNNVFSLYVRVQIESISLPATSGIIVTLPVDKC